MEHPKLGHPNTPSVHAIAPPSWWIDEPRGMVGLIITSGPLGYVVGSRCATIVASLKGLPEYTLTLAPSALIHKCPEFSAAETATPGKFAIKSPL